MRRHHHAFEAIGRLGGFHDRRLAQIAQHLGRLGDIQLLLAPELTQSAQRRQLLGAKVQLGEVVGGE